MKFPESKLAHQLLDCLEGIEIGGSAHNSFGLKSCRNVDYTDDMNTVFKINEEMLCDEKMPVDIVAEGDDLPLDDRSVDYVISSHVLEHFFDPIAAIKEWLRVVKPSGYVFMIVPTQDAIPTETRPPTTLQELIDRHEGRIAREEVDMGGYTLSSVSQLPHEPERGHWSVWNLEDFLPVCTHYGWRVAHALEKDDKAGNGWCVVIQK
jgi:SAM-dependent methyltransferase